MPISLQQRAFFETFGYLRFDGLLADRIGEIAAAFDEVWEENGGGHNGRAHDGAKRSCIVPFIDRHPLLSGLLDEPRITEIAETLLGADFNYCTSDGNYYSGDTFWHSHPFFGNRKALKIAFYLDALTRDTGCLRVIPGSHRLGDAYSDSLNDGIAQSRDLWNIDPSEIPSVALECKPGDILVFNHCLKHGSFGGGSRRRLFVINCSERFPEENLPDLREMVSGLARFWVDSFYGEVMVSTADARRMSHLEQVLANQDHLPALAARMRAQSHEPSRG